MSSQSHIKKICKKDKLRVIEIKCNNKKATYQMQWPHKVQEYKIATTSSWCEQFNSEN